MLTPSDLTVAQLERFQAAAAERRIPITTLLSDFRRDPWMENAITGTLPHCDLYGLMEADGRCHT